MKDLLQNKWFKFGFWGLLYLLWVIWLGNYWWLLGLVVIFDNNVTKKVKWLFWKKKYKEGEKHNFLLDWLDAIIFAVVVVSFINIFFIQSFVIPTSSMESSLMTGDYLFVSKLSYGPRIPQRPLSVPFVHNVLPLSGKESYSDLIKLDYKRLKGFSKVKRGDIVVFSWPHGDTVLMATPTDDYYTHARIHGREYVQKYLGPVRVRPVDKKDIYVKRAVAVAGDTLQIVDGKVIVNGLEEKRFPGVQSTYSVVTNGTRINNLILEDANINPAECYYNSQTNSYPEMPLTEKTLKKIVSLSNVLDVKENIEDYSLNPELFSKLIFPFSKDYQWTQDNFGPLYVPSKGSSVKLDLKTLPLYQRIITAYEGNTLEVKDSLIYVNGKQTDSYTFAQDYYFMMGDNRHNSLDSRYWGFVPEDHVVGKPAVIWFSSDKNKSFPRNIRWNRLLKFL